ncbi:zinc ribbon domain-containing protein [Streptomyces sp. Marseille-Q5077]|uniref:zinc ribbon domain-containing protein n=1 Tax=Streptomyces sp. Marseille-Q5077 TaxID=3418995 RepID=UPI003D078DD2
MSAFSSEKLIAVVVPDLAPVADDVVAHFKERGYETVCIAVPAGGHEVSITKGGVFKKALGLRTALKIEILPQPTGTLVRAGVGIFGKQAVPLAIALLVTWPVLLTQIWGLINQAGLDDEAIKVTELSLNRLSRLAGRPDTAGGPAQSPDGSPGFCHRCGQARSTGADFCTKCGAPRLDHMAAT